MQQEYVQYHPELAGPRKMQQDGTTQPSGVEISDHVALLCNIPRAGHQPLKIITWNVQEEATGGSGFAPLIPRPIGDEARDPAAIIWAANTKKSHENKVERNGRHQRIIDSLDRMVRAQQPDFVTLQEIANKLEALDPVVDEEGYVIEEKKIPSLLKQILDRLGADWDYMPKILDEAIGGAAKGNITLFRKNTVDRQESIVLSAQDNASLCAYAAKFTMRDGASISIFNVHAKYYATHSEIDMAMKNTIARATTVGDCVAVVGDFNKTIAPLTDVPQNIVTDIMPSYFRNGEIQGACAIDGGFYVNRGTGVTPQWHQAHSAHLKSSTGEVYSVGELPAVYSGPHCLEARRKEIDTPRLMISIDPIYQNKKVIFGKLTAAQFTKILHEKYGYNENIFVGHAVNNNNNRSIAFQLNETLYRRLQLSLDPSKFQFVETNGDHKTYQIFASIENTTILAEELIIPTKDLDNIKNKICTFLEKYKSFYKLSIFGHHHNRRAATVIEAIKNADTISDIKVILQNQKELFEGTAVVDSHESLRAIKLLGTRYASASELKNKPESFKKSGFYKAICDAQQVVAQEVSVHRGECEEANESRPTQSSP